MSFPLIFEISQPGRQAYTLPSLDVPVYEPKKSRLRQEALPLAQVSELDLVRHYTNLSQRAKGIDNVFYPLGSCTMKYNPKMNDRIASLPGFANLHPEQDLDTVSGLLEGLYDLQVKLSEITGMDAFTLQPAAGAHGEFLGLSMIAHYHQDRGDHQRTRIIVPDSAHGTNPASASMAGFDVVSVPSNAQGGVDLDALKLLVDETCAGLMLTNPNTLGLFDPNVSEIVACIHDAGGLVYYDGANMNAIMGISRPGDVGFDVVHLNLHKTFSTPHGGGGPGAGPVGVKTHLKPYLPTGTLVKDDQGYHFLDVQETSVGRFRSYYGNILVAIRAYAYILRQGKDGLKEVSMNAVLNANYMMAKLKETYHVAYPGPCMHEFVLSLEPEKKQYGVSAKDIAKALLDENIHPPTMYFPLIVHEALMIEPTETESKETMDHMVEVLISMAKTIQENPDQLLNAPYHTIVSRVDDVLAARHPILRYPYNETA